MVYLGTYEIIRTPGTQKSHFFSTTWKICFGVCYKQLIPQLQTHRGIIDKRRLNK
jgi:hypothetical protein